VSELLRSRAKDLLVVGILFVLTPLSVYGQPLKKYCEAEILAQESASLTSEEGQALAYYRTFNTSSSNRYAIGSELIRRHLDSNQGPLKPDKSPVSACLLKTFADGSKESPTTPFAEEAYALRLLHGHGVPQDRAMAISYFERSAYWGYPSAATHLARIYLADKSNPKNKEKAVFWLDFAAFVGYGPKSVGGWSAGPGKPIDLLFKVHIEAKDWSAAEDLYRRARIAGYPKDRLIVQLMRVPGLKARIDAEDDALALRRLEEARRRAREECIRIAELKDRVCWFH
jgi:TPR repeat protein